jgi:hypothetical protein
MQLPFSNLEPFRLFNISTYLGQSMYIIDFRNDYGNIRYSNSNTLLSNALKYHEDFNSEYDLLATYNILMNRSQYFSDIEPNDIKKYLLSTLDDKYSWIDDINKNTIKIISLYGYLLINCIIMKIQHNDIINFLNFNEFSPRTRTTIELEDKDIEIITYLYQLVREGIINLP